MAGDGGGLSGNCLRLAGDDAERVSLCQVLGGRVALLAGGLGLGVQRGYGFVWCWERTYLGGEGTVGQGEG